MEEAQDAVETRKCAKVDEFLRFRLRFTRCKPASIAGGRANRETCPCVRHNIPRMAMAEAEFRIPVATTPDGPVTSCPHSATDEFHMHANHASHSFRRCATIVAVASIAMVASQDGRFTIFKWAPSENMVHAHRVEALLI